MIVYSYKYYLVYVIYITGRSYINKRKFEGRLKEMKRMDLIEDCDNYVIASEMSSTRCYVARHSYYAGYVKEEYIRYCMMVILNVYEDVT